MSENAKDAAFIDAVIYGQGFYVRGADGRETHIPVDKVLWLTAKRYHPDFTGGFMDEDSDGDYVLHSDYAADLARLTAELERKQRECEGLREDAERWRRWLPWLHQVKRLPFDLAVELKQIREAALSAGEKK